MVSKKTMFIEELEFIAQNKTCGRGVSNSGQLYFSGSDVKPNVSGRGFPLDLVHSYCGISYNYRFREGWYNHQEYSYKYNTTLFYQERNSTR